MKESDINKNSNNHAEEKKDMAAAQIEDSDVDIDNLDLNPPSKIMLYISCSNLPNKDTFSFTDPFCKMYIREDKIPLPPWNLVGKTETMHDSLNPEFATPFTVKYYFEKNQLIKFEIYDHDGPNSYSPLG